MLYYFMEEIAPETLDEKICQCLLTGIMSATDVVEFLLAGATAVQVGTASFVTPGIAQQIAHDLEQWMQDKGVADVRSLIGALQMA